jgi:hypothetical protein
MAVPISVVTGVADAQLDTAGFGRLMGYSVMESATSAAVATLALRQGTTATGAPLAFIELAANGSSTVWFGPQGIQYSGGLFLDRIAGECTVVVWVE